MTPRKGKKFRRSEAVEDLCVTHAHAAGIDVHSAVHFVAWKVYRFDERLAKKIKGRKVSPYAALGAFGGEWYLPNSVGNDVFA